MVRFLVHFCRVHGIYRLILLLYFSVLNLNTLNSCQVGIGDVPVLWRFRRALKRLGRAIKRDDEYGR